jgi:hypothetical protein
MKHSKRQRDDEPAAFSKTARSIGNCITMQAIEEELRAHEASVTAPLRALIDDLRVENAELRRKLEGRK